MLEILDEISDLVVFTSIKYEIIYTNNQWKKKIGKTQDQTTSIQSFIHPESKDDWISLINQIPEKKVVNQRISLISKDGRKILAKARLFQDVNPLIPNQAFHIVFRIISEIQETPNKIEHLYATLVEYANDGIYYSTASGHIQFMNSLGTDLLGYETSEILSAHFTKFISDDHKLKVDDFYQRQFKEKRQSTYLEFPIRRPDGDILWVGQNVRTVFNKENPDMINGYIGIFRDVTLKRMQELELLEGNKLLEEYIFKRTIELEEANKRLQKEVNRRKRIEGSLHKKQKEYEQLFQNAHDAIIIFNPTNEVILEANTKACELYGFTRDEIIGKSLLNYSLDIRTGKEYINQTLAGKENTTFTTTQMNKNGEHILLEVSASAIKYRGRRAIISINRDITSRTKLAKQLETERKQKVSALIDGQELERKRIAQELHDGIGQMLSSLVRLIKKIESQGSVSGKQYLGLFEAKKLTNDVIDEIRRISKNLMPSVLSDFGLGSAIQGMVEIVNKGDIDVLYDLDREIPRMDRKIEIGIYRIIQEAVTNALRHAGATQIHIASVFNERVLEIKIIDDGNGFNVSDQTIMHKGNGIANMIERAELLGASLAIKSEEKIGSQIVIKIKYDGKN